MKRAAMRRCWTHMQQHTAARSARKSAPHGTMLCVLSTAAILYTLHHIACAHHHRAAHAHRHAPDAQHHVLCATPHALCVAPYAPDSPIPAPVHRASCLASCPVLGPEPAHALGRHLFFQVVFPHYEPLQRHVLIGAPEAWTQVASPVSSCRPAIIIESHDCSLHCTTSVGKCP